MPRKKRPLNREVGELRDASLIVIASEDLYAVYDYFANFKPHRVHIEVLPTEDCRSSPKDVADRLANFERDVPVEPGDTLWLCIDRDRWSKESLEEVMREAKTRGHNVALSNPCFELWVLLHFTEVGTNPRQTCAQIKELLRAVMGGYGKQCCKNLNLTKAMVEDATSKARRMDTAPDEWLPDMNVTRVYRIMDTLIAKGAIEFIVRPLEPLQNQEPESD